MTLTQSASHETNFNLWPSRAPMHHLYLSAVEHALFLNKHE